MNAKQFENDLTKLAIAQERVMAVYRKKGFVKSKEDEQALHMSFSPNRVPKGLTKLQVRRRINKYLKGGNKNPLPPELFCHRLEIKIDGKSVLGASFVGDAPQNSRQLARLLKGLYIRK